MRTSGFAVLFAVAPLVVAGCGGGIEGSGTTKSEKRTVSAFKRLQIEGAVELAVVAGKPQSVTIETDDNILGLVKTEVAGDQLVIRLEDGVNLRKSVKVAIEVPALDRISVTGVATGSVDGLAGPSFELVTSGAGNLTGRGSIDTLTATLSGAAQVDFAGVKSKSARVEISGAGALEVHATDLLVANISGAGSVKYSGSPKKIEKNVSGVGSIEGQ